MLNYGFSCSEEGISHKPKFQQWITRYYVFMGQNGQTVTAWMGIGIPNINNALYGFKIKK